MNVLSLFDGISCGQIALNRAGIPYSKYYASEIDKHSIGVTQMNYPNTIQLGDVRYINGDSLPQIDLLIGGSPCQGFSFAGKQLNFDDPRSSLFFEFTRLLKECKPKYFLLENVVMRKEYQDIITQMLHVEPILINSSLVSAQNRKRLYWTNIPGFEMPNDRKITWKDVREDNQLEYTNGFSVINNPNFVESTAAIRGRYINKSKTETRQYIEFRGDGKTNTLTTVAKDNVIVPFSLPRRVPSNEFPYRYITPLECERLQTIPDGYTRHAPKTQRFRMIGNAWTVDIIVEILKGLRGITMPGIPRSLTLPSRAQLEWHQYPTESQAVRACWREFFRLYPDALSWRPSQAQPIVLDHSMGTGVWGAVLKEFCPWVKLIGVELQIGPFSEKYDEVYIGWNFLEFVEAYLAAGKPLPALVFGNGPFKQLEEFFHAGLELLPSDGLMYNLVPDTFMSTKERSRRLWFPKAPQWVLHSTRRFRFDKTKSGTDYKEYLMVVHQKDNYPRAEDGYRGW